MRRVKAVLRVRPERRAPLALKVRQAQQARAACRAISELQVFAARQGPLVRKVLLAPAAQQVRAE